MSTPLCHRLLDVGYGVDEKPTVAEHSPACIGSRCSAWSPNHMDEGTGNCGLTHGGRTWPDPSRPTTLQTQPKPRPSAEST